MRLHGARFWIHLYHELLGWGHLAPLHHLHHFTVPCVRLCLHLSH